MFMSTSHTPSPRELWHKVGSPLRGSTPIATASSAMLRELCGSWIERHQLVVGQWELFEPPYYSPTWSVKLVDFDGYHPRGS